MDTTFPDYDDLPSVEGISEPCAWGLFSRNGEKDLYGCLHKVTPDIIREATAEVKDGVSISLNPHAIKVREIEEIAREQGVTFKQGDVIIIRTGYTDIVGAAEPEEQEAMINTGMSAGVEGSIDAVKWFWNTHCSAVASDSVGFEVLPATKDGVIGAGGSPDLEL
ncbi:unnamed protein product [Parascedosporium putredinis]|uniref:Uncharacterized protein n=1 Tax=Parascedosporium putredinis TaxID=1442378 RepID=A0A9P1H5Y6_9PEZI|nr:unnamed protein product [Parascedosporium putredinis]CAI7996943.1 unnamed protein product [Parascedosporium putredinis]